MPAALSNPDLAVLAALRLQKKLDSASGLRREDFQLVPLHALRPVRPQIEPREEVMMASGPARLSLWDAPGDGSYNVAQVPMHLNGIMNQRGANFLVGAALGTAAMNIAARRRARKDMQARWMEIMNGPLTVSTHGIYLEDRASGINAYDWGSIDFLEWKGFNTLELVLRGEDTYRCLLQSDWAELVLVAWVHQCFPQFPGKYGWLTREWRERVTLALGADPVTGAPALGR